MGNDRLPHLIVSYDISMNHGISYLQFPNIYQTVYRKIKFLSLICSGVLADALLFSLLIMYGKISRKD